MYIYIYIYICIICFACCGVFAARLSRAKRATAALWPSASIVTHEDCISPHEGGLISCSAVTSS